jgi:aryl-alcohol dehydrogenase
LLIDAWTQRARGEPPRLERLELTAPRSDEILVRLAAVGICHTDLIAEHLVPLPAVFGHEGAGIVEAVGHGVATLRPGDRVVLTFGSCGSCRQCNDSAPAYCEHAHELNFGGARLDGSLTLADRDGAAVHGAFFQQSSFATHALAAARNAVRVPDEFPLELAAPLGCGIQTGAGAVLNTLAVPAGSSIAIFGAGPVGLSAVMVAALIDCNPIIVIDVNTQRLQLARQLGATHTIAAGTDSSVAAIRDITSGGAMFSVETAGAQQSFRDSIDCLAKRGICGLVTVPDLGKPFSFAPLPILQGRSVVGVLEGSSVPDIFIPQLMDLHLQGHLPYDRFCSFYGFRELPTAIEDARAGRVIKPILRMNPGG